jgi:hypothetical protein
LKRILSENFVDPRRNYTTELAMRITFIVGTTALAIIGSASAIAQPMNGNQYGYQPPSGAPPQYAPPQYGPPQGYGPPQYNNSAPPYGPPQQQYSSNQPPSGPPPQQQYSNNGGPPPDQQNGPPSYNVAGVPQYGAPQSPESNIDVAVFTASTLAALKTSLKLTTDQEKNWSAFEQAANDLAKLRTERAAELDKNAKPIQVSAPASAASPGSTAAAAPSNSAAAKPDTASAPAADNADQMMVEGLQEEADALSKHGAALKKFADAMAPLYKSLDDTQKQQFSSMVAPILPQSPPFTFKPGDFAPGRKPLLAAFCCAKRREPRRPNCGGIRTAYGSSFHPPSTEI